MLPTLREYSKDFLEWVDAGRLEADSRRYYRNGWRLLLKKIAGNDDGAEWLLHLSTASGG